MGFRSFGGGSVLRDSQVAPANSTTTGSTQTGVVRDARPVPPVYDMDADAPSFVDAAAYQYKSSIVEAPGTTATEYLVWSANTANLAGPADPDPTWWTESGYGTIPAGLLTVGPSTDGSSRILVTDNGNRDIGRIYSVVVSRGDVSDYDDDGWKDPDDTDPASFGGQPRSGSNPYITLYFNDVEQDARLGLVYLTGAHLTLLDGGISVDRGDHVVAVHYTVSSVRFWWSKNDRYESRFGWAPKSRRWEPFKGSPPSDIGAVADDTTYTMTPSVLNLPLGSYLPGDSTTADAYSMIRVGASPSASQSVPVDGVVVSMDSEIGQPFTGGNGRMGQSNGVLEFSQTFVDANRGKTIWYTHNTFQSTNDGVIGPMTSSPIFIAPVPSMTETPLLRFGSRKYLTVLVVKNDSELLSHSEPLPGNAIVSASTGMIRLCYLDVAKADVTSTTFNKSFLGEVVVYDGISLSGLEQPTRAPVQMLNQVGAPATAQSDEVYIPSFVYLPDDFALFNTRRGLGVSGVIDSPDATGATPDKFGVAASIRPGGDNTVDDATGRVRVIRDGVSDTIIFTQMGSIESVIEVDNDSAVPLAIPGGTAYVVRKMGAHGSRVFLSSPDKLALGNKPIFFLQSAFNPATHTNVARIVSRNRSIFRFDGSEVLRFAIDGNPHTWSSSSLVALNPSKSFFTAGEVVADIGIPTVYVSAERIVIESVTPSTGSVEIGFGVGGTLDISGCKALGFVPGWRAVGGIDNWLPDSGVSVGMYRTPLNLSGTNGIPDFKATGRVDNQVLIDGVQSSPFYFLNTVPLQDVAGIDDGIFFSLSTTVNDGDSVVIVTKNLEHYLDIIHRFANKKFDWVGSSVVDGSVENPTVTINLQHPGISPESFESVVGGGLYVSSDGAAPKLLTRDTDYIVQHGGGPGNIVLVNRFGHTKSHGSNGVTTAGGYIFSDSNTDFSINGSKVGDILSITSGPAVGLYTVTGVSTALFISPSVATSSVCAWDLINGYPHSDHDPAMILDVSFIDFEPLPQETMAIRVLTPVDQTTYRALMSGALASGRSMSLRIGHNQLIAITMMAISKTSIGTPHTGLVLPDTDSVRFSTGKFAIQAGPSDVYTPVPVATFSTDPIGIEYLTSSTIDGPKGTLKFGSSFMSTWSSAPIYYVELFLDPSSLQANTSEYDPNTGEVNLSAADRALLHGKVLYFVEQMITTSRRDVAINPILGSFSTNSPLTGGSMVEVSYWQSDIDGRKVGDQITEFLPVFVRNEISTRVRSNVYTFNTALNHIVDNDIEPVVYIGPIRQNYGQVDYVVDYPLYLNGAGRITFVSHTVPDNVDVKVSYAVYDMLGGERAFEVSSKPVYRPPFYIGANQDRFGLRGDRTSEFLPGQMLRVGDECFYIKSTKYYPANSLNTGDVTAVYIFPSTINEVGSRAPGNDVVTVVTYEPVTTVVDPDGVTPVYTTAHAGTMTAVSASVVFDPIVMGQKTVVFYTNITRLVTAGHILEIGGIPYTVMDSRLDETGTRTRVTVTSAFRSNLSVSDNPTIKLTNLPIYPPGSINFLGAGPVLSSEPYKLLVVDSTAPGVILNENADFFVDTATGDVVVHGGLGPSQKLIASFTRLNPLIPTMHNGVKVTPRYTASFLSQRFPDESNGILNSKLTGTYTFSSPDSFYFRAVPLRVFLGEVVGEISLEMDGRQPATGALNYTRGNLKNWQNGAWDLLGERRALSDKDRVARTFLEYYNNVIVAFEQVNETISGGFVGDKDGKFHFWVGHSSNWPTPGYEDDITGCISVHSVWTDVINQANPAAKYFGTQSDPVVDPFTITVVNGEVTGGIVTSDTLTSLVSEQRHLVFNDIDDVIMESVGDTSIGISTSYPYYTMTLRGSYKSMGDEHQLSRIFPTKTAAMIRTLPGIGSSPGVYSAGTFHGGKLVSTTGDSIAQLRNPVVGNITNVSSANLHKRMARARIWGWFPNGIPANSFGVGVPVANIAIPCVIAVPALLKDVLIRPETGYPDVSKFLSQNVAGTVIDANSGDPELAVPGFEPGDQIAWGKPDGSTYPSYNHANPITVFTTPTYTGVFVDQVLHGCVITFKSALGLAITDHKALYAGDISLDNLPIQRGDTIFVTPPTSSFVSIPPDPPEFSTFQTMTSGIGTYRDGFDVKVTPNGNLVDISLPSKADGTYLALKEMFGQNAPSPMEALEGSVYFSLGNINPLSVPALRGFFQDDSGDYKIPYLVSSNTEIDRFSEVSIGLSSVYAVDDISHAVYPNEVVGVDGYVVAAVGSDPSSLKTSSNTSPGFGPGEGDVRPYDLLLNQVEAVNPFSTDGAMGIHTIGSVNPGNPSTIEVPRFITRTKSPLPGSTTTENTEYVIENAMVFTEGPYPLQPQIVAPSNGVYITEDVVGGFTVLDFGTTPIVLNNGQTVATGNLNDIFLSNCLITIKIIARQDTDIVNGIAGVQPLPSAPPGGVVALTINISGPLVQVINYQGGVSLAGAPGITFGDHVPVLPIVVNNRQIRIPTIGVIPWGPGPGTPAQWFLPHSVAAGPVYTMLYGFEYLFTIDSYNSSPSTTAWISDDRLTFNEVFDLSMSKKRGFVHPQSGISLETMLSVYNVTVGQTVATDVVSSVNRYVNGMVNPVDPIPLTFVPRFDADTVGHWIPRVGAVTERGSIKVMSFEGHNNTPVTASNATMSAVPSDDRYSGGQILSGIGKIASDFTPLAGYSTGRFDNRITEITTTAGSQLAVEPCDIVVVSESANANHPSTHQAGTYLVRHVIGTIAPGDAYVEASPTTYAGWESGWCPLHFPTVVAFNDITNEMTMSDLAPAESGPIYGGNPSGWATPAAWTRVYVIRSLDGLASAVANTFKYSVISAKYTAVTGAAVFTLTDYKDALGNVIAAATFGSLLDQAYQVSGMTYWPVNVSGSGLPNNNVVGFDSESTLPVPALPWVNWAVYGFHGVSLVPQGPMSAASTLSWTGDKAAVAAPYILKGSGTSQCIVPILGTVGYTHVYQPDPNVAVYPWVVKTLQVTDLTHTQWQSINVVPGSAGFAPGALVDCILPGTKMDMANGVNSGFFAQTGIFFEPTFPRSSLPVIANHARVVDVSHSLPDPVLLNDWDREVGSRDSNTYSAAVVPDEVAFSVRRIRRFHDVLDTSDQNLSPLRYAYEIRRGVITAYSSDGKQRGLVSAVGFTWTDGQVYTGTQLGMFSNHDVNVNTGDVFRVLDVNGNVVEESRIETVVDGGNIVLAAPGLTSSVTPGVTVFNVFVKRSPVPHEQSCEELLEAITDKRVTGTISNWTTQKGGYVPDITGVNAYDDVVNKLYDDLSANNPGDFSARGVKKGDIVIVDPSGAIPKSGGLPSVQEHGSRPLGDAGVPTRLDPGVYVAGTPNPVDDNRGFYRVKRVVDSANPPYLVVDPINVYSGSESSPVVFADDPYSYAVYPTVTNSNLKKAPYPVGNGVEAQMALRPTLKRDVNTKSFSNRTDGFVGHSIRPFSYHVIRPTPMFSNEAVDLVLMMRERILSLIELLHEATVGKKHGSYFVFQRDGHIKEIGSPTDPDVGLGLPSNLFVEAIGGRVDIVPYSNNSGCLSILDRRVWVHDNRLDTLTTDGFGGMKTKTIGDVAYTDYTGTNGLKILPVLPDRVNDVLDITDKFRQLRYLWLSYRTNKILGTLTAIRRFDAELPNKLSDRRNSVKIDTSAGGAS